MNSENELVRKLEEKLGISKQAGKELQFQTCPYCNDTSYHFYVNPETYQFHCFKCNIGGGYYGLTKLTGMNIPEDDIKSQELKEIASKWFRELLASDAMAENLRSWLESRGIARENLTGIVTATSKTEIDHIPKFLPIGFYPGTTKVLTYFQELGYTSEEILEAGLMLNKTNDTPYLVFIYHSTSTKIARFKLRKIDGTSKDTFWLGQGQCGVFGLTLYNYSKKDEAIGVEGETDCLSLQVWTWKQSRATTNVVGLSGGAAGSGADILARLGIRKLRLIPDNDKGGLKFVANCIHNDMSIVIHRIPEGYKDIDDYIQKAGKVDLQGIYNSQSTPGTYLANGFLKFSELTLDTPEGLQDARQKAIEKARVWKLSGNYLNDFINGISEALQTKPESLRESFYSLMPENFFTDNNRYISKTEKYGLKPVSNFTLSVERAIYSPDDTVIREIVFTDTKGNVSSKFELKADNITTITEFSKYCLSKGNYFFDGNGSDLNNLKKLELSKVTGLIYQPDRIGYLSNGKCWMFGNKLIPEGGEVIYPDEDDIFWLNGKGYMPISFEMQEGSEALPVVSIKNDIQEYKKALLDAIYGNIEMVGLLGLGWCASHVYMPEIVKQYRCFPELFIYGKRMVGKNTLGRWIMNFFGLSATEKTLSETSQNWISRALSYYSGCPVWLDEYRNDRKVKEKNGVLRNAFDRIGAGKGQIGFGGSGYPVRGSIILSGQSLPDDNALLTRCLVLRLSKKRRDDTQYETVNRLAGDMSCLMVDLIQHKTPENIDKVLKSTLLHRGQLIENKIEDRDATIYSIVLAGLELLAKDIYSQKHLADLIQTVYKGEAQRDKEAKEEESELSIFWNDVSVLIAESRISSNYWKFDNDKLYIWFQGFYNTWSEYYRRRTGENAFPKNTILDMIKEESYFRDNNKSTWLDGNNRKCLILDFSKCPDMVKECFHGKLES
jgi:hypothetical protein